ncbi:hypothetical protein SAMN06298226_2390 [Nitrosovibrio sp. Nv4]|nr:hypothetical protein SAMN06298226_2390 [Nitrosovibrio sp. Nv4]
MWCVPKNLFPVRKHMHIYGELKLLCRHPSQWNPVVTFLPAVGK